MNMVNTTVKLNGTDCIIVKRSYRNSTKSVCLDAEVASDGFPYARLTVNLPDQLINKDEAFIDVNNCPWAVGSLMDAGVIGSEIISWQQSGFVNYPLFKVLI